MVTATDTLDSQLAPGANGKEIFIRHMVLLAGSPNETHPGPTEQSEDLPVVFRERRQTDGQSGKKR